MRISDWSSDVCSSDLWVTRKSWAGRSGWLWPLPEHRRCSAISWPSVAIARCCRPRPPNLRARIKGVWSMGDFVRVERRDRIAILKLDSPARLNAIGSIEACADLCGEIDGVGADDTISVDIQKVA